jgi:hypothetical protein
MRGFETLQGESGNYSFARVQGAFTALMVIGLTAYSTLRTGVPMAIPDSWLTLLGISMGGYLGAKGITATVSSKTSSVSVGPSASVATTLETTGVPGVVVNTPDDPKAG